MARKWWTCRCGYRNENGRSPKCLSCGENTRPKLRVSKHAQTLRDDSYALYRRVAEEIHGVTDESCCVCGKPPKFERRHDRDHDHKTGRPRGLACPGNQGCNALMPRWMTAKRARLMAEYLERVESFYALQEREAA